MSSRGFYIKEGCCTACGVPVDVAPELFGWKDESDGPTCYLKRQPLTEGEVGSAIEAMLSSEFDCIRYAGSDERILSRIAELDGAYLADDPSAVRFPPIHRRYAEFDCDAADREDLVRRFAATAAKLHYDVEWPDRLQTCVAVAWFEKHWHRVTFVDGTTRRWALILDVEALALIGLRRLMQSWANEEGISLDWHGELPNGDPALVRNEVF